jgi:hypothetical protein
MFATPELKHEPMPEMSLEQKADLETVTSGESGFESAEKSLALKTKGQRESPDLLQMLLFFSSSSTCACLMSFILLI